MTYEEEQREEHQHELDQRDDERLDSAIAYTERENANLLKAVERLEKQNAEMVKKLNWLVNTIPVPEIELARSAWGNTNTACVLEARAKAVEALAQVGDA